MKVKPRNVAGNTEEHGNIFLKVKHEFIYLKWASVHVYAYCIYVGGWEEIISGWKAGNGIQELRVLKFVYIFIMYTEWHWVDIENLERKC